MGLDILSSQLAIIGRRELRIFAAECGFAEAGSIPKGMTFRDWCEVLGAKGLKVDGLPFTLANRPSMHFVYDLIPSTIEEAWNRTVVMQKCAQVGFTVMEMLAVVYWSLKFEPIKIGMYLPDMKLAQMKSSLRFVPIVRTIPEAHKRLVMEDSNTGRKKAGEGNVMARQVGESNIYFLWTTGKATTESMPMDILSFDEVQSMSISSMEKTRERVSASRYKFVLMGSTANWPDSDINHWFLKGKQYQFHTDCPACNASMVLDEHFPKCIQYDEERRDYRYQCVHCAGWIDDAQIGRWIAKRPEEVIDSIHYPQFLSPTISPREIIEAYRNATDLKNFYNRKLGKPFADPNQIPVTLAHLNRCVDEGKKYGVDWKKSAKGDTFLGIDNMGGYACAIVLQRHPSGRPMLIHAEQIHDINPWNRLDAIMRDYRIEVAVSEQLPNYDSAKQFAHRHEGRVFLVASYTDIADDMMRWGDATIDANDRKTDSEHRDRYTLTLDQYKMMSWAFARITSAQLLMPDPKGLIQTIYEKDEKKAVTLLSTVLFDHFQKTALVTEVDEKQHKMKRHVEKIKIDPHFSYALMMAFSAWCRAHGTGSFIMPDAKVSDVVTKVMEAMPGLPANVAAMMDALPTGVCGSCFAFENGQCTERGLRVGARDTACELYMNADPSA